MDLKIYERETEQQMREDDYRFDNEYMTNMRSDIDADEEMLSIDNYTMTPVFDAKDRQRKFNAYLVDDDENLIRIQDTDPAGIDSYEYGLIQEYLKNYVSISEGEDTEDEMDSERHSRQGSNDESYCNGIEYLEDKGQEATAERTTIKHNYYKTSSFRETCFPRLWARSCESNNYNFMRCFGRGFKGFEVFCGGSLFTSSSSVRTIVQRPDNLKQNKSYD